MKGGDFLEVKSMADLQKVIFECDGVWLDFLKSKKDLEKVKVDKKCA